MYRNLTCLEAVVSVELVDIGALQPVPQQRQEVHQEEAPLETGGEGYFTFVQYQ